jgi:hypothetical protein
MEIKLIARCELNFSKLQSLSRNRRRRRKSSQKAWARISINLHLFAFLRAHLTERLFAFRLRGRHAVMRTNLSARGRRRHRPLSATESPVIRLSIGLETGLVCQSSATSPGPLFPDKRLIPCNLRKRRLLRLSELYREFEFLLLRHAVCGAEKSSYIRGK